MSKIICLDIGSVRIGVAIANSFARVAHPNSVVLVDGQEVKRFQEIVAEEEIDALVVGLPRNMDGAETKQTQFVRDFASILERELSLPVFFQDESLTSVEAERRLQLSRKPYTKGDIDKEAATIILQDYLDEGGFSGS